MKRRLFGVLVALVTLTGTVVTAPAPAQAWPGFLNCYWRADYDTAVRTGPGPQYPAVAHISAGTVLGSLPDPRMCHWGHGGNIWPPLCPVKPNSSSFMWAGVGFGGEIRYVYHSCMTMFFA